MSAWQAGPSDAYDHDMTATTEILQSIERRLSELKQEIETLHTARAALNGRESRTTARSPKTATDAANGADPVPARVSEVASTPVDVPAAPPPSVQKPAQRKPAQRKRTRAKRTTEVVPAGKLELLLSAGDGLTTTALAEQANADRDQVLTLLREMEAVGQVRRIGQRRSTRWRAITDEERIAQRAAELAAQSRARS
jgi:hypothetical protein